MSRYKLKNLIYIFFIIIFLVNCQNNEKQKNTEPLEIDFSQIYSDTTDIAHLNTQQPLYLAISAMTSPKESYIYYEQLIHYLSKKLSRPIYFKQRRTYEEVNDLLERKQIDFAFVCSGAYVIAKEKFPIEIIAVPVVNSEPYYYAYILVHQNSLYQRFEDLQGKSFAFTDPLSNTGYLYVLKRLKGLNSNSENFFSRTIFTYAHDYSIQAVARKIVDGATIDGLIFEYLKEFYPHRVENIRTIEISEPFGIPPIVASKRLPYYEKKKIQTILYKMHQKPDGREILNKLMIDRFVSADKTDYSSIRNNLKYLNQ